MMSKLQARVMLDVIEAATARRISPDELRAWIEEC